MSESTRQFAAPAKCEECGGENGQHVDRVGSWRKHYPIERCSKAQPSPTTEAPETICDECGGRDGNHRQVPDGHGEWDRCVRAPKRTSGVHIDSMPHEIWASGPGCMWSEQEQALRGSVKYIRADVVEERVAEARAKVGRRLYLEIRESLGAVGDETAADAARRVVAERDERTYERDKYYAKARTYGASAAKYRNALVSIASQGIEKARKAINWSGQHCTEEEHNAIDRLMAAESERDTALARVRELEAKSVHLEQVSKDYREAATSNLEKAETAERELGEARAALEKIDGVLKESTRTT